MQIMLLIFTHLTFIECLLCARTVPGAEDTAVIAMSLSSCIWLREKGWERKGETKINTNIFDGIKSYGEKANKEDRG